MDGGVSCQCDYVWMDGWTVGSVVSVILCGLAE